MIQKTCEKCAKPFEVHVEHVPGFTVMGRYLVQCPHCGANHHPELPGEVVDIVKVGP